MNESRPYDGSLRSRSVISSFKLPLTLILEFIINHFLVRHSWKKKVNYFVFPFYGDCMMSQITLWNFQFRVQHKFKLIL